MLIDPPTSALTRRVRKAVVLTRLKIRNFFTRTPVTDRTSRIDVSLTSFGDRLDIVGYAIESIALGSVLPRRIILWVAESELTTAESIPMLRRLIARGLEVRGTVDYRSYKKIYPYALTERRAEVDLVTADDDCLYPSHWLSGLVKAAEEFPGDIIGYRGAAVSFGADGHVLPYTQWRRLNVPEAGARVLLTGVAGIRYPSAYLAQLAARGDEFLRICPSADDLWMHQIAVSEGWTPRLIDSQGAYLLSIPRTQQAPLNHLNVVGGQNDVQFAAITSAADLTKMRASADSVTSPQER